MQNKKATEYIQLGEEHFKSRRFKEAVEQFQEYIWINPSTHSGRRGRGAMNFGPMSG